MTYVHRIAVANPEVTAYQILVSEAHGELAEDRNWNNSDKVNPGDAVLYHHEWTNRNERPFAFSSANKQWMLDVEVRGLNSEYHGRTVELTMWDEDTYATRFHKRSAFFAQSNQPVASAEGVAVFRITGDGKSPLGFFGAYRFWIRHPGDHHSIGPNHSVTLEAYYLSTPALPLFFGKGIPLLFLRMFVLPQRDSIADRSIEKWVSNVTEICFGSKKPFDRQPSSTKDHWLIYNTTGGGASSFTSGYGRLGLNLEAWLDAYRNWKQHSVYTRVNCYDQAAITEVALCLGVSHHQVHWEYHQVHGFIDTKLVGWGRVNSPYFDDIKTRPLYENKQDPDRAPFNNHAYLSWSKKPLTPEFYDNYNYIMSGDKIPDHAAYAETAKGFEAKHETKLYMIDACGGPHVGNENRAAYEAKIERIPNFTECFSTYVKDSYKASPAKWKEEHHLGTGVTELHNLLPASKQVDYQNAIKRIIKLTTTTGTPQVLIKPNIPTLQDVFRNYVNLRMRPRWNDNSKEYPIRPYTMRDGTTIHEVKINFSFGAHTRLDRAASMRIAVNDKPGAAQEALAKHLAFKALSIENAGAKLDKRSSVYEVVKYYKTVPVVGTYYIRAFVWQNVAVEVTVEHDDEWEECDNALLNKVFLSLIEM
ncbi:hypothetical protein CC86DRAFT_419102 [Ophiobolus disseminans]|uniref:Uncharacterized protein n=1 Tax=Ophiobolus disseminans TaxID=1469910 RepID=A0A6A6ZY44_9PLEO|nr:hypothetical protein CC86DRAFT_419102 [Ophiobolus disseminans]